MMTILPWFLVFLASASGSYFEFRYRMESRKVRLQDDEIKSLNKDLAAARKDHVFGKWVKRADKRGRLNGEVFVVQVPFTPRGHVVDCAFLRSEVHEAASRFGVIFSNDSHIGFPMSENDF